MNAYKIPLTAEEGLNLLEDFLAVDGTYIDDVAIIYEQMTNVSSTYWGPYGSGVHDRTDLPRTEDFETEGFTDDFYAWADRLTQRFIDEGARTCDELYDKFLTMLTGYGKLVYIVLFTQGGCGIPIGAYKNLDKARKVMRDSMMTICARHTLDKSKLVWRTWREREAKNGTKDAYLYMGNELVYTVYHNDYDATFSVFACAITDNSITSD